MTKTDSRRLTESLRGNLALLDRTRAERKQMLEDPEIQAFYDEDNVDEARKLIAIRYPNVGRESVLRREITTEVISFSKSFGIELGAKPQYLETIYFDRVEAVARKLAGIPGGPVV